MTSKSQSLFYWIFAISIVNLATKSCNGSEITSDNDNNFDVLVFTQQWARSECVYLKAQNEKNACASPTKKDTWTIHGIWPSKQSIASPNQPAFCRSSTPKFDVNSMKPDTVEQLKHYWPSIRADNANDKFWEYEWNKHGKCALEQFDSPNKYFELGLAWIKQYSVYDVLANANILPGSTYDIADVNNALKSAFHVNAMISCAKMKDSDGNFAKQYLREVKLCFTKQLELMDCGKTSANGVMTNCDKRKKLYYPDYVPSDTDHDDNEPTLWRFTYHFFSLIFLIIVVLIAYKTAKNFGKS